MLGELETGHRRRRLFLSFDLSIAVVEQMLDVQELIEDRLMAPLQVRWVEPENIRLTLKVLGRVESALIPMIEESLEGLIRSTPLPPFEISCEGVGIYPNLERPQILWAGLAQENAKIIGLLQKVIERDLEKLGIALEGREFKPYITLGRVRSRGPAPELQSMIADCSKMRFGRCYIKDLALFEVVRQAHGVDYRVLQRFALGAV